MGEGSQRGEVSTVRLSQRLLHQTRIPRPHRPQLVQMVAVPVDAGPAGVDLQQLRPRSEQLQDVVEPEDRPLGSPQRGVDGGDGFIVLAVVDGEAVRPREVAIPFDIAAPEALRPLPQKRCRVLALPRLLRLPPFLVVRRVPAGALSLRVT